MVKERQKSQAWIAIISLDIKPGQMQILQEMCWTEGQLSVQYMNTVVACAWHTNKQPDTATSTTDTEIEHYSKQQNKQSLTADY